MNLITKLAYNALTKTIQAIAPGGVSIALGTSESGRYLPTLTGVSNIAAAVPYASSYIRVANIVTVSGYMEVDLTTASVASELRISLPIPSNLSAYTDCAGAVSGGGVMTATNLVGDAANNTALLQFTNTSASNIGYSYVFQYEIK